MALEKINLRKRVYDLFLETHNSVHNYYTKNENFSNADASFSAGMRYSFISSLPIIPGGREIQRNGSSTIEKMTEERILNPQHLLNCKVWATVTSLQRANFCFHRHSVFSDDNKIRFDNLLCLPLVSGCYQIANPKDKSIAPVLKSSGYYTSSQQQIEDHKKTGDFLDELHGDEDDVEDIFTLNVEPGDAVLLDTSIFHKFKSFNMFPSMAIFCPQEPNFYKAKMQLENLYG